MRETLLPDLVLGSGGSRSGIGVTVEDGVIVGVGPASDGERLAGRALMPGFVNDHSHAFQRGLRGHVERVDPARPHDDFWTWRERMYGLAEALDRRLQEQGRALEVFVQVNTSGEDAKTGLRPDAVEEFVLALRPFASLRVRGLMTLAVYSDDQAAVGACFARLVELQRRLRQLDAAPGRYDELSMGMSGDFELAIAHGATTVRVGQTLFGARPPVT